MGISQVYGDIVTFYGRDREDPTLDTAIEKAQLTPSRDYRGFAMHSPGRVSLIGLRHRFLDLLRAIFLRLRIH
jgi:hypothetical protein